MLQSLHDVENALQMRDLSKCLAWCHENRSKLKKNKVEYKYTVLVHTNTQTAAHCIATLLILLFSFMF